MSLREANLEITKITLQSYDWKTKIYRKNLKRTTKDNYGTVDNSVQTINPRPDGYVPQLSRCTEYLVKRETE